MYGGGLTFYLGAWEQGYQNVLFSFAAGGQRKYFNAWRMHRGNQQEPESSKEPEPDAEKAEVKDSNEGEKSVRVVQRHNNPSQS